MRRKWGAVIKGTVAGTLIACVVVNAWAQESALSKLVKTPDDAKAIAEIVIQKQFGADECPHVIIAAMLGKDSIRATCSNRENFMVLSLRGTTFAMRCSSGDFSRC